MTTPLDLNALEALATASTPDLMAWVKASYPNAWTTETSNGVPVALFYGKNPKADAEFSARARGNTLALIARIRELEAALATATQTERARCICRCVAVSEARNVNHRDGHDPHCIHIVTGRGSCDDCDDSLACVDAINDVGPFCACGDVMHPGHPPCTGCKRCPTCCTCNTPEIPCADSFASS